MYKLFILKRAQKELAHISSPHFEKIVEAIHTLTQNPRPSGCKKLMNREGWRIRTGHYRVLYTIDDVEKTIQVLHIGHRRDVYR